MLALLMIGNRLVKVDNINGIRPALKYCINVSMLGVDEDFSTNNSHLYYDSSTTGIGENFSIQELIFRLNRRIDAHTVEYQFEHLSSSKRFAITMYDRIVELEVPPKEINLRKLVSKMRSTLKAKELLTRYYNS